MTNIENWMDLYDAIIWKFLDVYNETFWNGLSSDNICLYGNRTILKEMGLKSGDIFPIILYCTNTLFYEMKVKEDNYILEHQNEDGSLTSNLFITSPDWIEYD